MPREAANDRNLPQASRRFIEPFEMSEVASAPSGWAEAAAAWIADMGEQGDYGRACVLDRPMLERIRGRRFATALDVGCGEGRFCRMLQAAGISTRSEERRVGKA